MREEGVRLPLLSLGLAASAWACPRFAPPPEPETFDPALLEEGRQRSQGRWIEVDGEARFARAGAAPRLVVRCEVPRKTLVLLSVRDGAAPEDLPLTIIAGEVRVKGIWSVTSSPAIMKSELRFEGPGFAHLLAARELEFWIDRDPPLVVPVAAPLVAQIHRCLQAAR